MQSHAQKRQEARRERIIMYGHGCSRRTYMSSHIRHLFHATCLTLLEMSPKNKTGLLGGLTNCDGTTSSTLRPSSPLSASTATETCPVEDDLECHRMRRI